MLSEIKRTHNQKVECLCFILQTYGGLKPRRQALSSEGLLQRDKDGARVYMSSAEINQVVVHQKISDN